jgi:hypothetical protein
MMFLGMDYLTYYMTSPHAYLILTTSILKYMHVSGVYKCWVLIFLSPIVTKTNGGNISKQSL